MSAGNTNRTAPGTHVIGSCKTRPRVHQTIKVGSFDIGKTKLTDGFVTLVVGKNEENIGFTGCVAERYAGKSQNCEKSLRVHHTKKFGEFSIRGKFGSSLWGH